MVPRPCQLQVCVLLLLVAYLAVGASTKGTKAQSYYFYNEVTGEVQWEDPGDVPYEEESGKRYWVLPNGEKQYEHPNAHHYVFVEQFNAELGRPYFYNQETKETSWERPYDLAWRRIKVHDEL